MNVEREKMLRSFYADTRILFEKTDGTIVTILQTTREKKAGTIDEARA